MKLNELRRIIRQTREAGDALLELDVELSTAIAVGCDLDTLTTSNWILEIADSLEILLDRRKGYASKKVAGDCNPELDPEAIYGYRGRFFVFGETIEDDAEVAN
jgi:hypothetical protein